MNRWEGVANCIKQAASISSAVCTSTRCTLGGVGKVTGPATSTVSAPASAAAWASANPIFPELWLDTKRTGSMASKVGPAVITTLFPANSREGKKSSRAALISSGSASRPAPISPQACVPCPGPRTVIPRSSRILILAWVAVLLHICWFMAGATNRGAGVARAVVVSRSSALPMARRARVSAVAGAIR